MPEPLIHLPDEQARDVVQTHPESGMGFRIVLANVKSSTPSLKTRHDVRALYVVFNAQLLAPADDLDRFFELMNAIAQAEEDIEYLDEYPEQVSGNLIEMEVVASRLGDVSPTKMPEGIADRISELLEPQRQISEYGVPEPEAFFRFSNHINDWQIRPDGGFYPGTYATTRSEVRLVPSGLAAVGRYALPSPLPARYVYPLVTRDTRFLAGATVPNNRQAGGGVEVLFPKGAKPCWGEPYEIPSR